MTIQSKAGELCAVKVPEGAIEYAILGGELEVNEGKGVWYQEPLPPGDWEIWFATDNVTEELSREVVDAVVVMDGAPTALHKDYIRGSYLCFTALESFATWMAASGMEGNYLLLKRKDDNTTQHRLHGVHANAAG